MINQQGSDFTEEKSLLYFHSATSPITGKKANTADGDLDLECTYVPSPWYLA